MPEQMDLLTLSTINNTILAVLTEPNTFTSRDIQHLDGEMVIGERGGGESVWVA
jgi:hypothetical protein